MCDFEKKQDELDKEIAKIWHNPFYDGIIHYETYIKEKTKLLWILKEPHGKGPQDFRAFYANPSTEYSKWKATFGNIIRLSWSILAGIFDYDKIPELKNNGSIDGSYILEAVAIININKQGGDSSTPSGKMYYEYKRKDVKDFLLKQIKFINPDIIINCHRVYDFISDQLGENTLNKINGEQYGFNKNRLIIDTGHPNVHGTIINKDYCNNILNIVKLRK
jgi:hypothetical protein